MSTATNLNESATPPVRRWVRLLHTYVSLYALLIVLFFGLTGFIMNHPDWFDLGATQTDTHESQTPPALCTEGDRLAIVEHLRKYHGLRGQVLACEVEPDRILVSFAQAARRAEVRIDRASGKTSITTETKGLAAALSAIHSGDHTGRFGRRVIDLSALFLILTSLSGIALWATLAIRRETGVVWMLAGLAMAVIIALRLLL